MPETNYDIFIAFKDKDDNDNRTWSSIKGEHIHNSLKVKGYSPFYSRETMNDMVGEKVLPLIDHALDTAKVMILVFSCPEEVNSKWVKYEWSEFMRMNKPIINVFQGMRSEDWEKIQPELANTQGIDLTDDVGAKKYNQILDTVVKFLSPTDTLIRQSADAPSVPDPEPIIKPPPKLDFFPLIQQIQFVSKPTSPILKDSKPKPTKLDIKHFTVKRTPLIIVVAVVLVVAMLGSIWSAFDLNENPTLSELDSLSKGDYFTFGNYPQGSNGEVKPIEWRVLAVKDGMALVISEKLLDYAPYNEEDTDVTWETCTLRKWMNNDFLNKAFSSSEQKKIATVINQNPKNPKYGIKGGNDTRDKIFALSIDEAIHYFTSDSERKSHTTDFSHKKGFDFMDRSDWWWLRSPGGSSKGTADVSNDGYVSLFGDYVNHSRVAVRPAFWLNL